MKIYQAIIWFSVLLVIGAGLMISGFDFVPIAVHGNVLGQSTNNVLEEVSSQHYPASYYSIPILQAEEEDSSQLAELAGAAPAPILSAENPSKLKENASDLKDGSKDDLNQMIEFLNLPDRNEPSAEKENAIDIDMVSVLINKNARVYLKNLQKELDSIKKGLLFKSTNIVDS